MKNSSSVSPCFEFRGKGASESTSDYVERLAKELDDEFKRQGPGNVCAFIAEPVVGAVGIPRPVHTLPFLTPCIIGARLRAIGARLLPGNPGSLPQARCPSHSRRGHVRYG